MTDLELVRILIGDNELPYHYSDAEITGMLTLTGNAYLAAGTLLKAWVVAMLREPNFALGSFSENHGSSLAELQKKADDYIAQGQAAVVTLGLYAGAISKADIATMEQDTDRPQPDFTRGMMRNPSA